LGSFTTQCDLALIQSGEQELRSNQTGASHALDLSGIKRAHYINLRSDGILARIVNTVVAILILEIGVLL
jgi:hypothetical protein